MRNIKSNGDIWTGDGDGSTNVFPPSISRNLYNENPLSMAFKISFGTFDYFTGGDMTGITGFGFPAWFDVETPVAKVVGTVDAMTLNHHGMRDASNEFFLKTLAPQVIIQQSWSSTIRVKQYFIALFHLPRTRDHAIFSPRMCIAKQSLRMVDGLPTIINQYVVIL